MHIKVFYVINYDEQNEIYQLLHNGYMATESSSSKAA